MAYGETKVYHDGSHYVAIPHTTRPNLKKKKKMETEEELKVKETAENADLKKRLDTSMGEVLELDKENKELKEHKVKTSIALTVLDRLKQEHPEIYREVISQKKAHHV